jgi:hypothetical protein
LLAYNSRMEQNPYEPPQSPPTPRGSGVKFAIWLVLAIFFMPLATAIAGFGTCMAVGRATSFIFPDEILQLLLGSIAGLVATIAVFLLLVRFWRRKV